MSATDFQESPLNQFKNIFGPIFRSNILLWVMYLIQFYKSYNLSNKVNLLGLPNWTDRAHPGLVESLGNSFALSLSL